MGKTQGTAEELNLEVGDLVGMSDGLNTAYERHRVGIVTQPDGRWTRVFILYTTDPGESMSIGITMLVDPEYRLFDRILPATEVARCLKYLYPDRIAQFTAHIGKLLLTRAKAN